MLLHLPLYHLHPRGLLEYKCIHVCKSKGELNKWASVAIVAQAPWPGGRRHIYVYIYIYIYICADAPLVKAPGPQ